VDIAEERTRLLEQDILARLKRQLGKHTAIGGWSNQTKRLEGRIVVSVGKEQVIVVRSKEHWVVLGSWEEICLFGRVGKVFLGLVRT
jgi:hypothetical protein